MGEIPEVLVIRMTRDAMQLRNMELCAEIRRVGSVIELTRMTHTDANMYVCELLISSEETLIGGAPDPMRYETFRMWKTDYNAWLRSNLDFECKQCWPRTVKRKVRARGTNRERSGSQAPLTRPLTSPRDPSPESF